MLVSTLESVYKASELVGNENYGHVSRKTHTACVSMYSIVSIQYVLRIYYCYDSVAGTLFYSAAHHIIFPLIPYQHLSIQ